MASKPKQQPRPELLRVFLYSRTSTKDGRQHIENQKRTLKEFARKANWNVIESAQDTVSGSSKARPGLDRLMESARNREIDIVCVTELSRLSRGGVATVFNLVSELRAHMVELWSISEPHFRTQGPTGELFLSIAAFIAQYERDQIITRVRAGLESAKRRGKILGRPRLVFDMDKVDAHLAEGLSINETARQVGVSRDSIRRRLAAREQKEEENAL